MKFYENCNIMLANYSTEFIIKKKEQRNFDSFPPNNNCFHENTMYISLSKNNHQIIFALKFYNILYSNQTLEEITLPYLRTYDNLIFICSLQLKRNISN